MMMIVERSDSTAERSNNSTELSVVVSRREMETSDVVRIDLRPSSGDLVLPSFEPGAHIDIQLPNGLKRSYSLVGPSRDPSFYSVAVKKDRNSRGGSFFIHESIQIGDKFSISAPKNYFKLDSEAAGHLFIAGGIGITPFISMILSARAANQPWRLLLATRHEKEIPFFSLLQELAGEDQDRIQIFTSAGISPCRLNIAESIEQLPPSWSLYCCGPASMLQEFDREAGHLSSDRVHVERFSGQPSLIEDDGFIVELAKTGKEIYVKPGQSILDALEEAGVAVLWGCREGLCGSCEVKVVSGSPKHLDHVLTEDERQSNASLMVCCSRSLSERLVLDL